VTEHTVTSFDTDLQNLRRRVAEMGGLAEKVVADAVSALVSRDVDRAQQVILTDRRIDLLQAEIEEAAISVIARRQPVALDLRVVVASMRVATDLERVGDLAKNIAKRVMAMSGLSLPQKLLSGSETMSRMALEALKDVLDAYTQNEDAKALAVWRRDGSIDAMHTSIFRELLTYMLEDPRNISFCIHLLFVAKNLERIGDHATNIAETVHFTVTGQSISEERPKGDDTSSHVAVPAE
jgi:phosphate transport system protein